MIILIVETESSLLSVGPVSVLLHVDSVVPGFSNLWIAINENNYDIISCILYKIVYNLLIQFNYVFITHNIQQLHLQNGYSHDTQKKDRFHSQQDRVVRS